MDASQDFSGSAWHTVSAQSIKWWETWYKIINVSRADYSSLLYGSSMNFQGGKMQLEIGLFVLRTDTFRSRKQEEKTRERVGLEEKDLEEIYLFRHFSSLRKPCRVLHRGILPNQPGWWRKLILVMQEANYNNTLELSIRQF